jgi:rhamnulokinase
MAAERKLLAIDLGASSGRGILGLFDGTHVRLEIIHRFHNGPVQLLNQIVWDAPGLFREILQSIHKAGAGFGGVDSVGVDTWGVDFGLLGTDGGLLGLPRHYRDPHTETAMDLAFRTLPRDEIYRRTGLQFQRFNTLYQLLAMQRDRSLLLTSAEQLLMMPDLFHYWLSGVKTNELTNASTTQLLNARTRSWDHELAAQFGFPPRWLGTLVQPGTVLGPLRQQIATDTGVKPVPVIAPATHDTASAVAAVTAIGDNWAYLSSGTWSLLGVELAEPIINDASLAANFTNEAGVGQSVRFLKNIMGLWLEQECQHSFARAGRAYSHEELATLADQAQPFHCLVDPDDPSFLLPPDMPEAIKAYCRRTNQPAPERPGAFIRCCLDSLALKYRYVLEQLEMLTGRRIKVLHVVGGGSQNALLNQFTADAINRPVLAGPVEATALGNVMVQALGLGIVNSLAQIREVVRQSVAVTTYEPNEPARWDEPYERFRRLLPA